MNNTQGKHSAESLMASALLKIRSDANSQQQQDDGTAAAALRIAALQNRHFLSNNNNNNPSSPSPVAATLRTNSLLASTFGQQRQHQSHQPSNAIDVMTAFQAAAGSGRFSGPVGPSSVSLMNLLSRSPNASLGILAPPMQSSNGGGGAEIGRGVVNLASDRSVPSGAAGAVACRPETAAEKNIRREKVEAALRSKPQRGRKRENLSDLERLELTRTRNREHAKSTRLRKKQRYQELLDCEEKLKEIEEVDDLNEGRKSSVMNFLQIRESLMRAFSTKSEHASPERSEAENFGDAFGNVIANLSEFVFQNNAKAARNQLLGMEGLKQFDEQFALRIQSLFGSTILESLQFTVQGGENAIALSGDNKGFAIIELTIAGHHLVKGIHYFEFADGSAEIKAASWTPLDDALDVTFERLNAQVSHPSVVSLDPAAGDGQQQQQLHQHPPSLSSIQEKSADYDCSGPGMSI